MATKVVNVCPIVFLTHKPSVTYMNGAGSITARNIDKISRVELVDKAP